MKTLKHHVLVFDEDCPLCKAYTYTFINTGMLDQNGREAYNKMKESTCQVIDCNRARNEIALVNTKTGAVVYGIDSLFRVIGHAFPLVKPIFSFKPFRWLMKKIYSFISYNRKVIIPARSNADSCVPDFNLKYRLLYLLFTWIVSSLILTSYSKLLVGVIPESRFFREFMVCSGQILFQGIIVSLLYKNKTISYLGNMMTISLVASLVLLVIMGVQSLIGYFNPLLYTLIFLGIAGLMLLEHIRRVSLLEMHGVISFTWVLYRLIILLIVV